MMANALSQGREVAGLGGQEEAHEEGLVLVLAGGIAGAVAQVGVGAVGELAGQACASGDCRANCCLVGVAQGRHPWMIWLLCPILDSA